MAVLSPPQEALPAAVATSYFAFLLSLPPDVVMGSFAGAVLFLLGNAQRPKWQWIVYFLIAFLIGLMGAAMVADIFAGVLGLVRIKVTIPLGMGALVASSCTINMIIWARDHAGDVLRARLLKGGKA